MATIYHPGRPRRRLPGRGPSPLVPLAVPLLSLSPIIGVLSSDLWSSDFSSDFVGSGIIQDDQVVSATARADPDPGYKRGPQPKRHGRLPGIGPSPLVPKTVPAPATTAPIFASLGGSVGITQSNQPLISAGTVISSDPGWNRPPQVSLPGRHAPGRGPAPLAPRATIGVFPLIIGVVGGVGPWSVDFSLEYGPASSFVQDYQTVSASAYVPFAPGYRRATALQPGRLAGRGPAPLVPKAVLGQPVLPLVAGGLSVTQDDETLAVAVTVLVTGTFVSSQGNQSISSAASVSLAGPLSVTQADETLSATASLTSDPGYLRAQPKRRAPGRGPRPLVPRAVPAPEAMSPVFGTLSAMQSDQSLSASATTTVVGVLGGVSWSVDFTPDFGPFSIVQADQSLSAVARLLVSASLSIAQADTTLSAAGLVPTDPGYILRLVKRPGRLVPGRGPRPIVPTAIPAPATLPPVFGTLSKAQDGQNITGIASAVLAGSLSKAQADHAISAAGSVLISVTLAPTQDSQGVSAAANVLIRGTLASTQGGNAIAAAAGVGLSGDLAATQPGQAVTAAGGPVVAGGLSKSQSQTITAGGKVIDAATLSVVQSAQTIVAASFADFRLSLTVTQDSQALSAHGTIVVLATLGGKLAEVQESQRLFASVSTGLGISTRRVVQIAPDYRTVEVHAYKRTVQIVPDNRLFTVHSHT